MKTLLSLFDYSGVWAQPYANSGEWDVIQWDIKLADFMDINLIDSAETALDLFENVDAILAGVPCTDFASSGARWFAAKDADGRTEQSKQLVYQVQKLVDLFKPTDPDYELEYGPFFWAVENPVGRIGRLTGLTDPYYFHPFEFAGYLNPAPDDITELNRIAAKDGNNITNHEADFILEVNAYTKKTGLWGEFNRNLVKKPLPPAKSCPQGSPLQRLGGKSDKTKEIRSNTPKGFALAFYEANK